MDLGVHRIEEAFCMFHDGMIHELGVRGNKVHLRIKIRYLAEMVHPAYHEFYVTLDHCYKLWLKPWGGGLPHVFDPERLGEFTYDILEATTRNGHVEVSCTISDPDDIYRGGELIMDAGTIQVYDEEFNRVSVDDLKSFSRRYWKNITVQED